MPNLGYNGPRVKGKNEQPRGRCRVCHEEFFLRNDRTLGAHNFEGARCAGSGIPEAEVSDYKYRTHDVVKLSGASPRQINRWSDAGFLRCEIFVRGGMSYRIYTMDMATKAAIMQQLGDVGFADLAKMSEIADRHIADAAAQRAMGITGPISTECTLSPTIILTINEP